MDSKDGLSGIIPSEDRRTGTTLKMVPLPASFILEAGRLVRAFAEIEDCLNCFISNLAGLSESRRLVILGRSAYGTRLNMARALADLRQDDGAKVLKRVFTPDLQVLKKQRDVVAHGVYLGRNGQYEYAFLSQDTAGPDGSNPEAMQMKVYALSTGLVRHHASMAENAIPEFERILQIESLRETRRGPTLAPAPQGQTKSQRKR